MKLPKSQRYALYAVMEMASASDSPVTVTDVAARYRLPESALAKIFQQLVRSGIAVGTRGVGGGYRMARTAADLTVLDVMRIFEAPRAPETCALADPKSGACEALGTCRLERLFAEVDEMARCTFASVTIETLIK